MTQPDTVEKLPSGAAARRERIIVAALDLIRAPSGVSVQMREVAEQAGVALGTLYRYFPSRQELLAYAYERWREGCLQTLISSNALEGETNAERFRNVTRRDFQFLEKEPNFCEISTTLSRISDPQVVACMRRIREKSYDIYMRSFEGMERSDVLAIIEIYAAVMDAQANLFVTGRITAQSAYEAMDRCIYMLLVRDPMATGSRKKK